MQRSTARWILAALGAHELGHAVWRWRVRRDLFAVAQARAAELKRPLIVIGAPHNGIVTRIGPAAYGCGDVCVDIEGCTGCPTELKGDITKPLPMKDDSVVVFCACVLEYVANPELAKREIVRIAGNLDNVFIVGVSPRTLTAYIYPGALNVIRTSDYHDFTVEPLPWVGRVGIAVALSYLVAKAW